MFPFQYKVPECVPCSFEGPDAHIRYSVQGIIIRYNGECISSQRIINVLREYDPKRDPGDSAANSVRSPYLEMTPPSTPTPLYCDLYFEIRCIPTTPIRGFASKE